MSELNKTDTKLNINTFDKKGKTLSAVFALAGSIAISAGIMMYIVAIIYIAIDVLTVGELSFWFYGSLFLNISAMILFIVSMVLSTLEFINKTITRDRLFVHIGFLCFSLFILLSYAF
jgi:hypothetical protein